MNERLGMQRPEIGIFADEIGIAIGIYGDWRLKAAFTPIFAWQGDRLRAVAVEGSTRPFVFGREVDHRMFRRAVPPRDRPAVAAIAATLSIRNLQHTGIAGLKLVLPADPGTVVAAAKLRAAARALAAETSRNDLVPGDVIIQLSRLGGSDAINAAFAGLEARGIGTALAERGDGLAFANLPAAKFPDLVAIEGEWFRAVARQTATARLFGALVHGYKSRGAIVLVESIATRSQLSLARDSGADWLSGPLLAPAALAGAEFPEEPLLVETSLDRGRVIQLFR